MTYQVTEDQMNKLLLAANKLEELNNEHVLLVERYNSLLADAKQMQEVIVNQNNYIDALHLALFTSKEGNN